MRTDTIDIRFEFPVPPMPMAALPEAVLLAENVVAKSARHYGAHSVTLERTAAMWTFVIKFEHPKDAAEFAAYWKNIIGERCYVNIRTNGLEN